MTQEDLLDLALKVTGMTGDRWKVLLEASKNDAAMNLVMREEWHSKSRDSEGAIREYYRNSDIWFLNTFGHGLGALLKLAQAGAPPPLAPWQKVLVQDFKISGPILDYGGGFFNDSWPMVLSGYKIALAEVRGPVTEFLKRFRDELNTEVKNNLLIVEVDEDFPIKEMYQAAVSFETLEHLLNPLEFVRHLHDHLDSGAPFVFSVSFGDTPHAPYHVAKNAALGEMKVWGSKLQEIGFRPYWEDKSNNHFQIWRKT